MSAESNSSLRQTVKQAMLDILADRAAPAAAKASAGRTLLEYFDDSESAHGSDGRRTAELSLEELDAEIHKLSR
jgi:hypothetical protein